MEEEVGGHATLPKIRLITSDSPRIEQQGLSYRCANNHWTNLNGSQIRKSLWPFQRATVERMRRMEAHAQDGVVTDMLLKTHIGVLNDQPGSGKTLSIATLLAFFDIPDMVAPHSTGSLMQGMIKVLPKNPIVLDHCSMVIVPHNIVSQWTSTFIEVGMIEDVDFKVVHKVLEAVADDADGTGDGQPAKKKRKKMVLIDDVVNDAFSGKYRVLIVSNTAYKSIIDLRSDLLLRVKLQRLVIDEADSIKINNFMAMPSHFLWIVSATSSCFMTDDKSCSEARGTLRQIARYVKVSDYNTRKNTAKFLSVFQSMHYQARPMVFVCCDEDFVRSSLGLPDPIMVKLSNPKLDGLKKRSCIPLGTLERIELGQYTWTGESPLLSRCNARHSSVEFQQRRDVLKDERMCALTLSRFGPTDPDRLTLPCCDVDVHRKALKLCVETKGPTCPICQKSVLDLDLSGVVAMPLQEVEKLIHGLSMFDAVANIVESLGNKRVLVFVLSKYMDLMVDVMVRSKINAAKLSGTNEVVNKKIASFARGTTRVLLLGEGQGQGINLAMADVLVFCHTMAGNRFKQMVGRGQRPGRQGELVVYHMQPVYQPEPQRVD